MGSPPALKIRPAAFSSLIPNFYLFKKIGLKPTLGAKFTKSFSKEY